MQKTRLTTISLSIALALIALNQHVFSHPGHGVLPVSPESVTHYAFEPIHLLPAIGGGLILFVAVRWIVSCRWRRPAER